MSADRPPRARLERRLYRLLLLVFPREVRERHGEEMEEAFATLLRREAARRGLVGRILCWAGAALDAAARGTAARLTRTRTRGGGEMLETLTGDLGYAVRSLARRPAFTTTAVATIALGIGANTSVFTVADGLLLTPLPYEKPEELVAIWSEMPERGWTETDVNPAEAWDWRARARTLEDLAVFLEDGFNLTGGDAPELVAGIRTTPNLLSLLGRAPALGRDFRPDELGADADGVAILTDGFWERRFGRDPSALGTTLVLDGEPVQVVGILPPDFAFLDERPDVFRPLDMDPATGERRGHYANAVARLSEDVTIDRAREELAAVARQLEAEHPEQRGWTASVVPLRDELLGDVAPAAARLLLITVGFILMMACVNVANLLLARGGSRAAEIAVRSALGAGRARLVRQLLTESGVLAAAGGALGLVAGEWGYRAIIALLPSTMPPVFTFDVDGSVLAYTAAATAAAALGFGLVPALRLSRGSGMLTGARAGRPRTASRFGSVLVVTQTALATVLLVGGGLLMRSTAEMRRQDFGFDPSGVLTARVAPPATQYDTDERIETFWRDVNDRVRALPGVVAAGTTQSIPLGGSNWAGTVRIPGADGGAEIERSVRVTHASEGLFEALGFRMASGRALTAGDAEAGSEAIVVNEVFVERFLTGTDPLGMTVRVGREGEGRIVGVVENVVERAVDQPPEPAIYTPIEAASVRTRTLVVRTGTAPEAMAEPLRRAVWAVDGDVPLYELETLVSLVDRRVGGFAVIGQLMGVFALLSLLLGAVGIYGVTAHAAAGRTGEIGVRLAMGARRGDVVRMVLAQGARRAALGLTAGLVAAYALAGALEAVLVGVGPRDPVTFAGVTLVLAAVSFLGVWLPARRAARTDPVRALASE